MKTEMEIGIILHKPRNTKDGWQPPEASRWARDSCFLRASRGTHSADTVISDFWPPVL